MFLLSVHVYRETALVTLLTLHVVVEYTRISMPIRTGVSLPSLSSITTAPSCSFSSAISRALMSRSAYRSTRGMGLNDCNISTTYNGVNYLNSFITYNKHILIKHIVGYTSFTSIQLRISFEIIAFLRLKSNFLTGKLKVRACALCKCNAM